MLRFFVGFLLYLVVDSSSLHDERRQVIELVRTHLRQSDVKTRSLLKSNWLENIDKIGVGYNIFTGSPACFTTNCQMDGFNHPIFKINYTSTTSESCIEKSIPNNLELECLPSETRTIDNDFMQTVENLHTSLGKKVDVSMGAKYKELTFSYLFSKEIKQMLDSIVKNNEVNILHTAQVPLLELSIFEPKLELTDNFRYVIDKMFCCEENDPDIEEYIKEFIFDYFGHSYVKSIVFGGEMQQRIVIDQEAKVRLEHQQILMERYASTAFYLSRGVPTKSGIENGANASILQNDFRYKLFMKDIKSIEINTKGGNAGLNNFAEWSKTVSVNPVIIKFKVQDIFRLLTKTYFPRDPMIRNKSQLIEKILNKYLNEPIYCYNNCGVSNFRGICEPTGYFQFGKCKCNSEWTGVGCGTPVPKSYPILHGTICGLDRSFIQVNCSGFRPSYACPTGWLRYSNFDTDLTVCYKNQMVVSPPVQGTLCGLHSSHTSFKFDLTVGCNKASSILKSGCPTGYQLHNKWYWGRRNAVCEARNPVENLPGTLCGMQVEDSINGPTCAGYNPGLRQCPSNYIPHRTAFNGYGFMVCVKQ